MTIPLLRIQNQKKIDQVVELLWDEKEKAFVTKGLKDLFKVKEIKIMPRDFVPHIREYAHVIGWLLESMSMAEDVNLPFVYQKRFNLFGHDYEMVEEKDFIILKPIEELFKDELP